MSKLARFSLAAVISILIWFGVSAVGGPYFGKISEQSSNDLATFLPKNADSTVVNDKLAEFRDSRSVPLIAVFTHKGGGTITATDQAAINAAGKRLTNVKDVEGAPSPAIVSKDNKAALLVVPLNSNSEFTEVFPTVRESLDKQKLGLEYKMGGPASLSRDLQTAFSGIDVTLLLVALSVVFVILLVVYRSPILPIIVLITAISALSAAILAVYYMAEAGWLTINGQVQGILFILVIGAATDYSLLYLSRLREELSNHESKLTATVAALKGSFEPILAAGGTVIVGLMCLLLSDLGSNRALGPVGAVGIAFSILSALTFLPAMLLLFGRVAYWPRRPEYDKTHMDTYESRHKMWAWVGRLVAKHPRRIWVGTSALLLVACLGVFQLKADGVPQSQLVLGYSESRDAQNIIDEHFPGGSGAPTYVLVDASKSAEVVATLDKQNGVDAVAYVSSNAPSGALPAGESKQKLMAELVAKTGSPQLAEIVNPFKSATPRVVDNKELLQVTLVDAADSFAARETIVAIRDAIKPVDSAALVGGITALQYDTNQEGIRDRTVIIPVILVAITIILMALLRSLVAPFVLLATTVVSFGATLGVSALLFNNVWHYAGVDPSVILFGFVFLVALGIDYNIFLMTRVREETMKSGVRSGTIRALVVTGGVITSAGLVLASTFAALNIIPILFLAEIAFVVAFGVLLDTIIVRSLLVPALTLEIGERMWWPVKVKKGKNK
jgi:RND superfamily putative drug exporter